MKIAGKGGSHEEQGSNLALLTTEYWSYRERIEYKKEHPVPEVWRHQHQMQIGILKGIREHILSCRMPDSSLFCY